MRQYLYVFIGLVLAGMIILTAAYPECRVNIKYPKNSDYYVYDSNGDRLFVSGGNTVSGSMYAERSGSEKNF